MKFSEQFNSANNKFEFLVKHPEFITPKNIKTMNRYGFYINITDSQKNTIFHTIYKPDILKWLITHERFNIYCKNWMGETIFHLIPQYIMDFDIDPNQLVDIFGNTILHTLVYSEQFEFSVTEPKKYHDEIITIFKRICEMKINLNSKNAQGYTFLHAWLDSKEYLSPFTIKTIIKMAEQYGYSQENISDINPKYRDFFH